MKTQGEKQGKGVQVISLNEKQCVWMKTGMVNFKNCDNAFDCTSCPFDKEISRKLAHQPNAPASWREVMRQPHLHKECRHMLTGRVLFKLCSHNYECKDCAYDQFLADYDQVLSEENLPALATAQVNTIDGFMAPGLTLKCAL
jgi:hypothetical protein